MQPVVHLHQPQSAAQWIALTGMLTIQMLVLALLAWKMLSPPPAETSLAQQYRNETYREILGGLATGNGAPDLVRQVEEMGQENMQLRTSVEGQAALIDQLQKDQKNRIAREASLQRKLDSASLHLVESEATVATLQDELGKSGKPARNWLMGWPLAAGTALLGIVLGFVAGRLVPSMRDWSLDDPDRDRGSSSAPPGPPPQHEIHDE